jgi:hypothetical protein
MEIKVQKRSQSNGNLNSIGRLIAREARRASKEKPLALCANGCGVPPKPPSLVICGACIDKITRTLESELERMKARSPK